jgi:GTPase SAR1 family protein
MVIMLVGNKTDLESRRVVTTEEGQEAARVNNLFFIETSAKTGFNIEEAFHQTATEIFNKMSSGAISFNGDGNGIKMGPKVPVQPKKKKCC